MTTGHQRVEQVLAALAAKGCKPTQKSAESWQARCPAHDDHEPSLSIGFGDNGKVLVHCHAGCHVEAVLHALGLTMADLMPPTSALNGQATRTDFTAIYDYADADGELLFQVCRTPDKRFLQRRPDGTGGHIWRLGDVRRVLYRLPELLSADPDAAVFVCEGERDVDNLRAEGLVATCNPGGAGKWKHVDDSPLHGRNVIVIPDRDAAGRKHADDVARRLHGQAADVAIIELPGLDEHGDVTDWLIQGNGADDLIDLMERLESWEPSAGAGDDHLASIVLAASETPSAVFNLTDAGNARRFVTQHGADMRYCPQIGWLVFGGSHWERDETGEAMRRCKTTAQAIYAEAATEPDGKRRDQLGKHALGCEKVARLKAMEELARSEPEIAVAVSQLDADPWLFACANGTIDLRTGELRPCDPADLITRASPVIYDPEARLDLWERFLRESLDDDDEVIAFLQRVAGMSLAGEIREEHLIFIHGPEASGKSTFAEAIKAASGRYAAVANFESFLRRSSAGGAREDIARLAGARVVLSIEVDEGQKLAEGVVKTLTGGDTVAARHLYKGTFEFKPQFTLWLVANHAPRVSPSDGAMWRRIVRVPFEQTVPAERRDPAVKSTLRDPVLGGPAVLAWMVQGCLAWQRDGLSIPCSIRQATEEYRVSEDIHSRFLDDCCDVAEGLSVGATELYGAYREWCGINGEQSESQTAFGRELTARGFLTGQHPATRKTIRRGLTLRARDISWR